MFDSIQRDLLWKTVKSYGLPSKLINIMNNTYDGSTYCMKVDDEMTDWFEVTTGIRQDCELSKQERSRDCTRKTKKSTETIPSQFCRWHCPDWRVRIETATWNIWSRGEGKKGWSHHQHKIDQGHAHGNGKKWYQYHLEQSKLSLKCQ